MRVVDATFRTRSRGRITSAFVAVVVAAATLAVLAAGPAEATTFSNPTSIVIKSPPGGPFAIPEEPGCPSGTAPNNSCRPGGGVPFPSPIAVSGLAGTVADVNVTLNGFWHDEAPADVDVLLVAPNGSMTILMSDACGTNAILNPIMSPGFNLTFDDEAATSLPEDTACSAGTFRPVDDDDSDEGQFEFTCCDSFDEAVTETDPPSSGPAYLDGPVVTPADPNELTALSTYDGISPNGTWQLYVADDFPVDPGPPTGGLIGGWSLDIKTGPLPSLYVSDVRVAEGNAGTTTATFTVSLSAAASSNVTFKAKTVNGTATAGPDYVAVPQTTHTLTPGQTSKNISVTVNGDTFKEANETFTLNLSAPGGAVLADTKGTATILDEEGQYSIYVTDTSVLETNAGTTTATANVTLSAAPGVGETVTVNVSTANGTATAGTDYVAVATTPLTFAAGETTKPVNITVNGDATVEPNETILVSLATPSGNAVMADTQGTATIVTDD